MDGGCTSIWLKEPMTFSQKKTLFEYEKCLDSLSPGILKGYSFWWKLKPVDCFSRYEQRQFKKHLGSEIMEEISICGLADPMFRAVEAIMKEFGGYYTFRIDNEARQYLKGEYYAIRKFNKLGILIYSYHIVDWEFIAGYFNRNDEDDIRYVYDMRRIRSSDRTQT